MCTDFKVSLVVRSSDFSLTYMSTYTAILTYDVLLVVKTIISPLSIAFWSFRSVHYILCSVRTLALIYLHYNSNFTVSMSARTLLSTIFMTLAFVLLPLRFFSVVWSLADAPMVKYPSSDSIMPCKA